MLPSLALAYAGMTALCFAMERHARQLRPAGFGRGPAVAALRLLGVLGLAAAFWTCGMAWGWTMGPVSWFGVLTAAGLLLVFLLPWVPRAAALAGLLAPLLVLLLLS